MNLYQQFIAKSRYARYLDKEKRREHWPETVARYFDFMTEHLKERCDYDFSTELRSELEQAVLNLEVMPSMRLMMTAGPAVRRNHLCSYNCSFISIEDPKAFDELLFCLMCGTGVGFSVERQNTNKLPEVPEALFDSETTVVVSDSKEGWAKGLRQLIALLYSGEIPKWDLHKVREAGSRLKTFGGRASGPRPLDDLFRFVVGIFKQAVGRKLTSLECHDLCCKIAEVVVVGGSRRSALISLSNLSDERMRKAKSGEWWNSSPERSLANNSAVYTERPEVGVFMKEWLSLYESKSGERGIFNRKAAEKQAERTGRRKSNVAFGTNPCQPGWATVLTPEGIRRLDDVGEGSVIWSGQQWTRIAAKWSTGVKPVYTYSSTSGVFVGTENHRVMQNGSRIEVKEASSIDLAQGPAYPAIGSSRPEDVLEGWMIGDGGYHKASKRPLLYVGAKDSCIFDSEIGHLVLEKYSAGPTTWKTKTTLQEKDLKPLPERLVPSKFLNGSSITIRGFLRGLYSANGSVCGNRVTLKSSNKAMIRQVQYMLSAIGIASYITTNKANEVTFSNGTFMCKESYDLNIGYLEGKRRFANLVGFVHPYKTEKLNSILEGGKSGSRPTTSGKISEVVYEGDHEVFDLTVEAEEHTYWTGGLLVSNCGEVVLRSQGLCNLTEVVCRPEDTELDLIRKARLAAILGTFQSTLTYFPYVRKGWVVNAEEERLLGVSLTGICDCGLLNDPDDKDLPGRLSWLKDHIVHVNQEMADKLGINPSVATTVVKPSGTVSQLVQSSSGIHPAHARYYIRRVRNDNKDPLTQLLKDAGVPNEPCVLRGDTTTVFSFPMKTPPETLLRKDLSALDHFKLWLIYKQNYTEHNPSITISVRESEWPQVGAEVWKNFDEVLGVSFLPYNDKDHIYKQAPYEEISEQKYEEMASLMPKSIDWDSLVEEDDNVEGVQTLACTGGFCEI